MARHAKDLPNWIAFFSGDSSVLWLSRFQLETGATPVLLF